jgi:hypothetical protein
VKRFIKEPGHADSYDRLQITFISGRTPELFLYDAGNNEIEKIDLSHMKTEQLHQLMVSKGFERKPQGAKKGGGIVNKKNNKGGLRSRATASFHRS